MSIEAMKLALAMLEEIHPGNTTPMAEESWCKAIAALRQAIAEAEQEPFEYWNAVDGWVTVTQDEVIDGRALQRMRQEAYKRTDTQYRDDPEAMFAMGFEAGFSSRTTPPQRKPLSDEEIDAAWRSVDYTVSWEQHRIDIARAIEAAHGIGEKT